ncbi:MAG: alpha/beta hydrolase [Cyanobacteria bacterium P01_A01_bin.84]
MLRFQPPGFTEKSFQSSLGRVVYYTQGSKPWKVDNISNQSNTLSTSTLIFLHSFGGGASAYEWSKVYPAFANTHQVIAADLIGWGNSEHPIRNYQIDDYLLVIEELIKQVSSGSVTVIASSLTAGFCIRLATQKPELFRSLYLTCPSGFSDFAEGAERRIPLQIINAPLVDKLIYSIGATSDFAVRSFLERFLFAQPNRISNEIVAAYLESAQKPNAEYSALAFLRGDLYFDLSLYLPQLHIPTAIAWGEKSQFVSTSLGRRLAAINPQAIKCFDVIPDTGVLPHLEQPSVITGLLSDWLQKL